MTRTSIFTTAAIATLIGCAETPDNVDAEALAVSSFAGIEMTLDIAPMNVESEAPEQDEQPTGAGWAPADLPSGTYWMTVQHVSDASGDAHLEPGSRQLVYVSSVDGVPMLHTMAPILSNGEDLSAQYVHVYTAPVEDGRCQLTTALMADGLQTGPDTFEMSVYFEDSVQGEDCYKAGYGDERMELASFDATFAFIPPVVDDPKEGEDPGADPNANL
jgi:hypothetical protein